MTTSPVSPRYSAIWSRLALNRGDPVNLRVLVGQPFVELVGLRQHGLLVAPRSCAETSTKCMAAHAAGKSGTAAQVLTDDEDGMVKLVPGRSCSGITGEWG